MKKFIYTAVILTITLFSVSAQNSNISCPYGGREDCTGYCGLFVDEDGDGFCDYGTVSQKATASNAAEATQTGTESATPTKTGSKSLVTDDSLPYTDNNPVYNDYETIPTPLEIKAAATATAPTFNKPYKLWEISLFLFVLYMISFFLNKRKVYTLATHRKIWNIALAVCFIVSCLFGILLTFYLNNPPIPTYYRTLVKYHVDFGIGMSVIGLFHVMWHWRYYVNIFKNKKKK
ncbi:MAG: DUF4405 domain-containing protein [Bacteroidales bacterium]|jgi:uncharacterized integral membrane protein|nr:DUF4405 domain-containing protein [Bacteroidales bacterium]